MLEFENALMNLIGEWRDKGESWDSIIGALEMQLQLAQETEHQEEGKGYRHLNPED